MAYERTLGWRKLPTEVFVCAKKSLKRGVSTPHPLHPTYTTLSRYTFLHPVPVVRPEGSQTPLVVTYPWSQKMKHWQLAPPPCGMPDPGVRPKSVAQLLSIGVRRDILMFSMLINLLLLLLLLLLWMSLTPEGTQPRGSGQIHPLETPSSSVRRRRRRREEIY